MADDKAIRQLVGRARRQWLNTAVINAGGRYALLPIALFSVLGMVFTAGGWAGNFTVYILLVLAIFAVLTAIPIFLLVRIIYATSRSRGAPDWALLLDRSSGSRDMIPSWLEAAPEFKPAIAAQIDIPSKVELGLKRNWGNLFLMLMLLAMPFGLLQWQDTPEQQENIADLETEQEVPPPPTSPEDTPPPPAESNEEQDENTDSSSGGGSSEDGDGNTEKPQPDTGKETSPEQPNEEDPEPAEPEEDNGSSNESGDGDGTPPEPEKNEFDPEEIDPNRVTPESRDGDTVKRERKKWIYDPEGENRDGTKLKPSNAKVSGEHALPRTSMTNEERATVKKLQELYK